MTREQIDNLKVNDLIILHSSNGKDYIVQICNINDFCEPNMKFATNTFVKYDDNIYHNYLKESGNFYFCGDDFISLCKLMSEDEISDFKKETYKNE